MGNLYAKLGPANAAPPGSDFIFDFVLRKNGVSHLAPNIFKRSYSANYAPVPIALSDHTPREFRSNNATEMTIEFEIVGDRQIDVEASLKKLRGFMKKSDQTGEPIDLIFIVGTKSWHVRIDRMEHTPRLWNPDTGEQRVHVMLQMHTTQWE